MIVFSYQGDGDLASIGTNEILHVANRGEKITVIFVNNAIYGMTGGQMAPTTLIGMKTTTSPRGRSVEGAGYPVRVCELLRELKGVAYLERTSVDGPKGVMKTGKALKNAFQAQLDGLGFTLVEVVSQCPTGWGQTPVDAVEWLDKEMKDYFPLGVFKDVTEEIISKLSRIESLEVASRTSVARFKETQQDVKTIGEELGVGFVLEGTVRWAGGDGMNRIRITPQLIRVADDSYLWAETYDRVLDDVFEIQSEIAQEVTRGLGVTLGKGKKGPVGARPTDNLEAYQAYLRGRYWASRPHFTYENWERSMRAFERAVELDPTFALAHAELARGHALVRYFRHDLSPERLEVAARSAQRASELAPGDPRVHLDLGYYRLWAHRDIEGAMAEFERAAAEMTGSAEILEAMADLYIVQGRWKELGCMD